jgi:uncharacterized protein YegL
VERNLCIAFILDESDSMQGTWGGVRVALSLYLGVRSDCGAGAGDLVSVIQFANRPQITLRDVSIQDALAANHVHTGGCTRYVPALFSCADLLLHDESGLDPVVIFLTDGEPNDQKLDQIIPAVRKLQERRPNLRFFAVGFRCAEAITQGILSEMCRCVEGKVIAAPNEDELKQEFRNIARQVSAKYGGGRKRRSDDEAL